VGTRRAAFKHLRGYAPDKGTRGPHRADTSRLSRGRRPEEKCLCAHRAKRPAGRALLWNLTGRKTYPSRLWHWSGDRPQSTRRRRGGSPISPRRGVKTERHADVWPLLGRRSRTPVRCCSGCMIIPIRGEEPICTRSLGRTATRIIRIPCSRREPSHAHRLVPGHGRTDLSRRDPLDIFRRYVVRFMCADATHASTISRSVTHNAHGLSGAAMPSRVGSG